MPVQFTCPQCGTTRPIPLSVAKTKRYCNIECAKAARRRPPIIPVGPSLAYISLSNGMLSRVSIEDAWPLAFYMWSAYQDPKSGTWYTSTSITIGPKRAVSLAIHRCIIGPGCENVDHIDGDGLNNERRNLRPSTHGENMANVRKRRDNVSGFKGVWWHRANSCWSASIQSKGESKYLGSFDTPEKAYAAYCEAAQRLHAEFARLS